jgi:hypothetical protein
MLKRVVLLLLLTLSELSVDQDPYELFAYKIFPRKFKFLETQNYLSSRSMFHSNAATKVL